MAIKDVGDSIISPVFNLASSVGNVFTNFFDFIILNILTPLLLIGFLILFFWAQFKLIQIYYLVLKGAFTFLKGAFDKVSDTLIVREIIDTFDFLPEDIYADKVINVNKRN